MRTRSIALIAAIGLLTTYSAAVILASEPMRPMPVVPSDDVIDFDWDAYVFERPKTKVVDLSLLPERVRALHGQRVRVRGYMMPSFKQEGIDRFILQSAHEMRFRTDRPIDEIIAVTMNDKKTATYSTRRVVVEGTMTIDEWMFGEREGKPILIYRLAADAVQSPR